MRHESVMLELGTAMPTFSLPDTTGRPFGTEQLRGSRAVLVAFICNHCPFVLHLLDEFVEFAAEYRERGLVTVAISSNDVATFPEDGPELMAQLARERHFTFPYLYDETQKVAQDFMAACTPDFFLFDAQGKLRYRGRFDNSRPTTVHVTGNNNPVTGRDMRMAADAILAGQPAAEPQLASMGCSMKWKEAAKPHWG